MSEEIERLRQRIARTGVNGRGYRQYSKQLRQSVMRYTTNARAEGQSYAGIARELTLPSATLLNWSKKASPELPEETHVIGFRPVELREETEEEYAHDADEVEAGSETTVEPVVVFPSGVRVEGIPVVKLPDFLERLGCY